MILTHICERELGLEAELPFSQITGRVAGGNISGPNQENTVKGNKAKGNKQEEHREENTAL